jgi:hypothetical protein
MQEAFLLRWSYLRVEALERDEEDFVRNAEDLERDEEDFVRDREDLGRDEEDLVRDGEDLGRDEEDLVRDGEDLGRDEEDLVRDGEELERDEDELVARASSGAPVKRRVAPKRAAAGTATFWNHVSFSLAEEQSTQLVLRMG